MLETAMHKHISNQLGRIKIRCHKKCSPSRSFRLIPYFMATTPPKKHNTFIINKFLVTVGILFINILRLIKH